MKINFDVFKDKNILIGICGSIAAYKVLDLIRMLTKEGANLKAVLTQEAKNYIPLYTLAAFTKNKVYTDFSSSLEGEIPHIDLANWADAFLIAPATANTISKIACGIADNLLTNIALVLGKGLIAPAMNTNMYLNPFFQENLKKVSKHFKIIEVQEGKLACGEEGKGKLAKLEQIYWELKSYLLPKPFENKLVLISTGPTKEYIDPIRFISNDSSGKLGYHLAHIFASLGAKVVLVSGVDFKDQIYLSNINFFYTPTTQKMFETLKKHIEKADIFISAAAVSDFKVENFSEKKIKKKKELTLKLKENIDILKTLSKNKKQNQIFVGFSLETNDILKHAQEKLMKKNLDLIIANYYKGMGKDKLYNVIFLSKDGILKEFKEISKENFAVELVNCLLNFKTLNNIS